MSAPTILPDAARCTMCPAGCRLHAQRHGPDTWHVELPLTAGHGLCPRGSGLVRLLTHHRRIVTPVVRRRRTDLPAAIAALLEMAGDGGLTLLVDANLASEQLASIAAWCRGWPGAQLALVNEPAENELLLGLETSDAGYLAGRDLAAADAFLILGDVFAANPLTARAVFAARARDPRTPIVVIDPAGGTAAKFATHRVPVGPGAELAVLAAIAAAAGVELDPWFRAVASWDPVVPAGDAELGHCMGTAPGAADAETCAAVLTAARNPAVLVTAEWGRGSAWRQLGFLAGRLATRVGGGVAPQTAGANALAAVRFAAEYETLTLAQALGRESATRVAIGADPLGLLGWTDGGVAAAAAPLPSETTAAAEIILPLAMTAETGGSFRFDGGEAVAVAPLLLPPAGVPTPAELVMAIARAAGVPEPPPPENGTVAARCHVPIPTVESSQSDPAMLTLLLGRRPDAAGVGELTAHCGWPPVVDEPPELRMAPARARMLGLENLARVEVAVGSRRAPARVRVDPELGGNAVVLPEGQPQARRLLPGHIDETSGAIVSEPAAVQVSA